MTKRMDVEVLLGGEEEEEAGGSWGMLGDADLQYG